LNLSVLHTNAPQRQPPTTADTSSSRASPTSSSSIDSSPTETSTTTTVDSSSTAPPTTTSTPSSLHPNSDAPPQQLSTNDSNTIIYIVIVLVSVVAIAIVGLLIACHLYNNRGDDNNKTIRGNDSSTPMTQNNRPEFDSARDPAHEYGSIGVVQPDNHVNDLPLPPMFNSFPMLSCSIRRHRKQSAPNHRITSKCRRIITRISTMPSTTFPNITKRSMCNRNTPRNSFLNTRHMFSCLVV
jgi:hypothetical protein